MTNLFMGQIDSIGLKIKKIRELKNYTQEYMAEQLAISQTTYARFEKEDADLTISKLKKISHLLEITIEELINFDEKIIFNNYGGINNLYAQTTNAQIAKLDKYAQYPDELIQLYKDKIKLLEEKILYLESKDKGL